MALYLGPLGPFGVPNSKPIDGSEVDLGFNPFQVH